LSPTRTSPLLQAALHHSPLLSSHSSPLPGVHPLSLHDALPISGQSTRPPLPLPLRCEQGARARAQPYDLGRTPHSIVSSTSRLLDRKSTRLNSSHVSISYAVFCLKKKTTGRRRHSNWLSTGRTD